ncbi:MAG: hypothetical protein GQ531_10455 [Sulfurovum sp.]|nr:hypothetical protein [Sulfurovum sp.]
MVTSLLISRKINDDKKILENNISEIDLFIKNHIPKDRVIQMGSMLTGELRSRLEDLGYKFLLKQQYRNTLDKTNKEMISESDMVLIVNLDQSSNMTDFEEYAKEQAATHESVYVLSLFSN